MIFYDLIVRLRSQDLICENPDNLLSVVEG
jgi:hypothetical protein